MSVDKATRVRKSIEAEYGPMADIDFLNLLADTLRTHVTAHPPKTPFMGLEPRQPGSLDPATLRELIESYPLSIRTVLRELSVYNLSTKSTGQPVPTELWPGIAVAIVEQILRTGELS